MTHPDHALGSRAEEAAAAWLTSRGWTLLARRQRTSMGELDLVAWDLSGALVAVEVKCRRGGRTGTAAEGLGPRQLLRLRRSLVEYGAALRADRPLEMRVDLVTVERGPSSAVWRIRRIPQVDGW